MFTDDSRFLELELALAEADATSNPSEVHGLACALLALGDEPVATRLADEVLPNETQGRARGCSVLASLTEHTREALGGTQFEFQPVLVADGAPVQDRVEAVVDWASGFLHGLGHAAGNAPVSDRLGQEPLAEMTQDLVQITRAEADDSTPDEADGALMELAEYLRVVAQLFYDELAPLRATAVANEDSPRYDA